MAAEAKQAIATFAKFSMLLRHPLSRRRTLRLIERVRLYRYFTSGIGGKRRTARLA